MNFLDVLGRNRIQYARSPSNPQEVRFNCPFCLERRGEPDLASCFHLNLKNGAGHCWHESCGYKSRKALYWVLKKLQASPEETQEVITPDVKVEPVRLPKDFQLLTEIHESLDREARNYLLKRGITPEQIKRCHIGVSYSGRYAYRIIFPVTDIDGMTLYALTSRAWKGDRKPKYLTNSGPKYLFNFNPESEVVILSEGVFKALRIEQVTGSCSASTLGHSLTDQQLDQIVKSKCQHVIVWPDPDFVGRKGAVKIADKLQDNWSGSVSVIWPVSKPADEIPLEEISELLFDKCRGYRWSLAQSLLLRK